nr:hypothetical protein [Tanacetum cinerariifolium]
NRRDLPKDTPKLEIAVLRYDGDECDKGIMQTKIELTLEQSQQGVSNDVLVSIEEVEELKRNVEQVDWIEDTDEEIDEHELEAHYSFVAKIQEDLPEDSNSNDTPLE